MAGQTFLIWLPLHCVASKKRDTAGATAGSGVGVAVKPNCKHFLRACIKIKRTTQRLWRGGGGAGGGGLFGQREIRHVMPEAVQRIDRWIDGRVP